MKTRWLTAFWFCTMPWAVLAEDPVREARHVLDASGVQGGLVVHLGCGDGRLTAALRASDSYLVHGLDADPARVDLARKQLRALGLYGEITLDRLSGTRLPYIDNLVNLLVAEELGEVPLEEVMRVLCPQGVACIKQSGRWTCTVKPRPAEIDDWTHYLHSASGNAVARDTVVGPPRRLQWVGSPRYARHHDRMSSVSAVVSAGGRVFTIFDQATPVSILVPPQWFLIARDAFNGTILWQRPIERWHTHLWPLKRGPAQLPRRLVAVGDRVYVTLALDGPLSALEAATGETVRTYEGTTGTEEIILADGVLYLRVNPQPSPPQEPDLRQIARAAGEPFYDEQPRRLMAIDADSGRVLWEVESGLLPGTLAAGGEGVFFHDGRSVVCVDRATGQQRWRSEPIGRQPHLLSFYMPTLVVFEDVVLFSGGKSPGRPAGGQGRDLLTGISASTGEVLWTADHPPSGYQSPKDVLVVGGLVWCGETTGGSGVFTGRDPKTGAVKAEFPPDDDTFWFHHRCYRGKATENYLLMSRTGTEFVDVRRQQWIINHWVRGACLYGVMPANGLLYAPQHPCACYLETKLSGFNALAPASSGPRVPVEAAGEPRLERGPAFGELQPPESETAIAREHPQDWPTFRGDAARSGRARTTVPAGVLQQWQTELGGKLTSPVAAEGKVFVACIDTHTIHALDAASGAPLWTFTAGGQVDSPPTIHRGSALFGSADGYVYCLRAADGVLAWRFRAAPIDQRLVAQERVESVWPVHGSVLVQDGAAWCVAGRSAFLDGGMRLWRLDPANGQVLSETVLDDRDAENDQDLHAYVSWLNMPVGLPDVLSSDGRYVYMRSQPFRLDGTRLPLERFPRSGEGHGGASFAPPPNQDSRHAHLFSPTGFLDDSWWHRTYWLYGSRFISGWSGYYLSGKVVPAGRILVCDEERVYGFGRKPQYFRWTTPIEHHLFAADKAMPDRMSELPGKSLRRGEPSSSPSRVAVEKSDSLNPAGKPLTVEAWIQADRPDGVVLAHGGSAQGYSLYLQGGRPHFTVGVKGQGGSAAAEQSVVGRWVHLAGVLTAEKQLHLYVDGRLAASASTPLLIPQQPQESIDVGTDAASPVTSYQGGVQFQGRIDEVRLYHRALTAAEIAQRAAGEDNKLPEQGGLVLAYSFDGATAHDTSGLGNHGHLENTAAVEGRSGRALRFAGEAASTGPRDQVNHWWAADLPLMPRALALVDGILFLAGPPDLIDEEQAAQTLSAAATQASLVEHAAAFEGRRGALLWAVSAAEGQKLSEQPLAAPPVFDGMAAADGRLFLATMDGKVLCFGGPQSN